MEENKEVYYELKCLYCDKPITNIIANTNYIECPYCNHKFTLYQVFSYNMWLSENHKANKLNKKPHIFKEVPVSNIDITMIDPLTGERKEIDYNTLEVIQDIMEEIKKDIEGKEEPLRAEVVHDAASQTAAVMMIQYNYLKAAGFNENQAFIILQKLIEGGFGHFE